MKRSGRLMVAIATVTGATLAILALTSLSSESAGPVTAMLERIGAGVGALEHGVRSRTRGADRATRLAWFAASRGNRALLAKPDSVLLGAYDGGIPGTLEGVEQLERTLGVTLPIVQAYGAWGEKPEQQFPARLLTAVTDFGSVPLLTWEPWLVDFDARAHPELPLREQRDAHGLAAIARGDYDFYVDAWAASAARFGRPIMLRFAHEMNDPYRYPWGPQHNTKEEYIAAWRHVVERFRAAGATNVVWIWSPHVAYEYWDLYYPGDTYVDWVATGVLNFGPIAQWSRWWSFDEIFGSKYQKLASFGKPVMVAELGSLAVGGDRAAWYASALRDLPRRYPAVKSVVFFNTEGDRTVTYQSVDWTITGDSVTRVAIAAALQPWAPGRSR